MYPCEKSFNTFRPEAIEAPSMLTKGAVMNKKLRGTAASEQTFVLFPLPPLS